MSCGTGAGTSGMTGDVSNLMGGGGFTGWNASAHSMTFYGNTVVVDMSGPTFDVEHDLAMETK